MKFNINEDFIREVKYSNEITDVISSYINLKKTGRLAKAICPFHNEKTPSFTVFEDTQNFYCFGCGAGGDVITFIMKEENLSYIETLRFLCERAGLVFPEGEFSDEISKLKSRIYEMNKESAKFFHQCLNEPIGLNALEYLNKRGFSMPIIKKFGIGFAPDSWDKTINHLKSCGFNETELLQGWLCGKSQKGSIYSQFRNRVMFPIFDLRGNIIAFSGRTLSSEDPRKYLNSGDTPVFKKSKTLFAMNFAKNAVHEMHNIIVCEGNLDVVAIHAAGFKNAVATLGTALTEEHVRMMSAYTDEVVLAYDSDEAGQKATKRAISILERSGFKTKVLVMQGAKDPDEYIKKFGSIRFKQLIESSSDATEYQIAKLKDNYDLSIISQKSDFIKQVIKIIANLSFVERDIYALKLSEELDVSKEAILIEIKFYIKKRQKHQIKEERNNLQIADIEDNDKINPERKKYYKAAKCEESLISILLKHNDMYDYIKNKISVEDFVTEFNKKVFAELILELESNKNVDIGLFNKSFDPVEIGKIMGFISKSIDSLSNISSNSLTDIIDEYIQTLFNEKKKITNNNNIKELKNDDLLEFINDLRKNK